MINRTINLLQITLRGTHSFTEMNFISEFFILVPMWSIGTHKKYKDEKGGGKRAELRKGNNIH